MPDGDILINDDTAREDLQRVVDYLIEDRRRQREAVLEAYGYPTKAAP